ncbi:TauD/TfdA family dioxygenase [Streptomyces lonarensis]|uniref:TauD/TfdA family dioxygenase n=1 Tax=Streptomyces lonarensis TaxID=700599 RepID=A0A7X6CZZ0_9ACTN|nr:TauD/TfdA family dioxygenase [Streptomyces lonarensis]NJQ05632.1 TauD/TfdA family dioxygenase [Streptomyces lonarensis]
MSTTLALAHPRTLKVPDETFHRFSEATQREVAARVDQLVERFPDGRVDAIEVDLRSLPLLTAEVDAVRHVIDDTAHFLVFDRVSGVDTLRGQAVLAWLLGTALGRPMVQNTDGWRLIEVYDRGVRRTIEDGARYHQTKQGAYMHNDAVNDVDPIDYLLLSCGQSAHVGGESILVDAGPVHEVLVDHPDELALLTQDFWFEKRGMSLTREDGFFRSPIIRYTADGEPLVRYFRTYIEVAHEKVGEPLTDEQHAALDLFDAVLDQSSVQYRVRLERGQTLVSADDRFLHTRTAFCDRFPPREIDMTADRPEEVNRYMFRMWSTKA